MQYFSLTSEQFGKLKRFLQEMGVTPQDCPDDHAPEDISMSHHIVAAVPFSAVEWPHGVEQEGRKVEAPVTL